MHPCCTDVFALDSSVQCTLPALLKDCARTHSRAPSPGRGVLLTTRRRMNACIRGLDFVLRGFEQSKDNRMYDQYVGDAMLLLAGIARR